MHLIIGGAYQGKLDYAIKKYGLTDGDIFDCSESGEIEFKKCVNHLERFTLGCVRRGVEPAEVLMRSRERWRDCIFICEDISAGVVPADAVMRAWREANGRLLNWLSPQAEGVTRIFCGLPQALK
jgi:adenosyl cobinamide kinase/adenosyl cobinamide phosphate guanylyltransferase